MLDLFGFRVEGLVLPGFAREEDQPGFVGLQAFDVEGQGFGGGCLPAGVDWDADCWREFAGDACFLLRLLMLMQLSNSEDVDWEVCVKLCDVERSVTYLQFHQSETSSSSEFSVVFDRWATDDWADSIDWSRGNRGGFRETSGASS